MSDINQRWEVTYTMSTGARDWLLEAGWEPFAVTSGNLGLCWHLRRRYDLDARARREARRAASPEIETRPVRY